MVLTFLREKPNVSPVAYIPAFNGTVRTFLPYVRIRGDRNPEKFDTIAPVTRLLIQVNFLITKIPFQLLAFKTQQSEILTSQPHICIMEILNQFQRMMHIFTIKGGGAGLGLDIPNQTLIRLRLIYQNRK